MKDQIVYQVNNKSICWRKEWVHQFESPFSVIEKFKMANCISDTTFFNTFVHWKHRGREAQSISIRNSDLYTLNGFDRDDFINILNYDVDDYHRIIDHFCSASLVFTQVKNQFSNYIRYCEECMLYNFHSIFHQLRSLSICPFHEKPLFTFCKICGREMLYRFNYFEHYACNCAYKISSNNHPIWYLWEEELYIKDTEFIRQLLRIGII